VVRLGLAVLLGALIGYERERRESAAGLRTHMLVALGTALFVLVPQQAGLSAADLSRVIQGVVAGVGFLGAGGDQAGPERRGARPDHGRRHLVDGGDRRRGRPRPRGDGDRQRLSPSLSFLGLVLRLEKRWPRRAQGAGPAARQLSGR
jgi:hypothetical protein